MCTHAFVFMSSEMCSAIIRGRVGLARGGSIRGAEREGWSGNGCGRKETRGGQELNSGLKVRRDPEDMKIEESLEIEGRQNR